MPKNNKEQLLKESLEILTDLGLPRAQRNDRSAFCLLAICGLEPGKNWADSSQPLVGIRAMLDFARNHYDRQYAENTRETFRRQTMHQLLQAQVAVYNPDDPTRPVNSPKAAYQLADPALDLVRTFGTNRWGRKLASFRKSYQPLEERFGREREMAKVPIALGEGNEIRLSPGTHSELIKAIVEEFAPRFAPGSLLVYAGDTGEKWGYFDKPLLGSLKVKIDSHGKMPDVVLYDKKREWLLLVESVTSHGPVDAKRHDELRNLFGTSAAGLVYVTAFPNRATMKKYLADIAWETEVWVAEAPTHLIHFDGERFLGPYEDGEKPNLRSR
jgi:BsuBI/PstI restriction endonuclease domain/BsuBI/PstI restriction endonuclease HTH domain